MSPAELLCLRGSLGLTLKAFAAAVGVDSSTVFAWEGDPKRISKPQKISEANARAVAALVEYTDRAVADLAAAHGPGNPIVIYSTDKQYRAAGGVLSAAWHRMVARRAAAECGARIVYRA